HARFGRDADPPELKIAIGDTISVTIWESATGGLFSEPPPERSGTGSRSGTEPLAPESRMTPPEPPGGSSSPFAPLFGTPNPRLGSPTPSSGQRPGASNPATEPFSIEPAAATSGRRGATIPDQPVASDGPIC